MKAFFVAAFVVMTASASTLQQPSAAKGSIEVVVVRAGSGEPIPGARVTLGLTVSPSSSSLPAPVPASISVSNMIRVAPCTSGTVSVSGTGIFSVVADSQGRYVFRDIDPGWYCIAAGANGYAKAAYGQRTPTGVGTPINLSSGEIQVLVPLLPGGTVAGRVRDSTGQPATGIQVQVLKATYNANGQRTFQSAGSGRTDDRGDYRLYWITPGRYYVMASSSPQLATGGIVSSPNELPGDAIAPTFYPNMADVSQATGIEVRPGADINGVDFFLPRPTLFRIRGRVIDGRNGQVPGSVNITLVTMTATGANNSTSTQAYNPQDGSFELRDVTPGPHVVRAQTSISSTTVTPATGGVVSALVGGTGTAQLSLNVTSDVNGIVLTVVGGASLPGRLSMEGQAVSANSGLDKIRVQLRPSIDGVITANIGGPAPVTQATNADGVFRIDTILPGEYRLVVSPLPSDVYVKQARLNQADALTNPLQIGLSDSGTLDVVLSAKGGQIDGVVADDRQQPARDLEVVIVPDRQRDRIELFKTARTDANGRFIIRGIAPGDYHVFAWEAIDPYGYFDPELLKQDEQKSKPVHISESSKESVNLKTIPPQ